MGGQQKRTSLRLDGYDYSKSGKYYVTICINNRENVMGDVLASKIILNKCGEMVKKWWEKLPKKFDLVSLDKFIIMPNHLHGIIEIMNRSSVGAIPCNRPCKDDLFCHNFGFSNRKYILGRYISWFKRMSTNEYIRRVRKSNWEPFNKQLWQRNYFERIIRNRKELWKIRQYIARNPINWEYDEDNPVNWEPSSSGGGG